MDQDRRSITKAAKLQDRVYRRRTALSLDRGVRLPVSGGGAHDLALAILRSNRQRMTLAHGVMGETEGVVATERGPRWVVGVDAGGGPGIVGSSEALTLGRQVAEVEDCPRSRSSGRGVSSQR